MGFICAHPGALGLLGHYAGGFIGREAELGQRAAG
jgi:hypothetical protein